MIAISIKLEGVENLDRKLRRIELNSAKKIVRKGVRTGAKVIQMAEKQNAESVVGGDMGSLLAKHTIIKAAKRQMRGSFGVSVMLRPNVEEFVHTTADGQKHYIPNAIEYGHAAPGDAGGEKTVPAMSFVRKAQDENKQKALDTTDRQIARDLEIEWSKR